jgi:hypothetical protein
VRVICKSFEDKMKTAKKQDNFKGTGHTSMVTLSRKNNRQD